MEFTLNCSALCKEKLMKIKKKALRKGVWFKVLSKIERIQIDLTIKVVDKVKSFFLAKILTSIVGKLLEAIESPVGRLIREVGMKLARRISEVGRKLGCKMAEEWARDRGFIQFLAITYINAPRLYKLAV